MRRKYANISLPKRHLFFGMATMRSRAIFCSIIVQNMAQLKGSCVKDDWESLVGLCDEFLYLGSTERKPSKRFGTAGQRRLSPPPATNRTKAAARLQHQPPVRARSYDSGRGAAAGQQDVPYLFVKSSVALNLSRNRDTSTSSEKLNTGGRTWSITQRKSHQNGISYTLVGRLLHPRSEAAGGKPPHRAVGADAQGVSARTPSRPVQ